MSRGARALLLFWLLWLAATVYTYVTGMVLPLQLPGDVLLPDWVWIAGWGIPLVAFLAALLVPSMAGILVSVGFIVTAGLCSAWTMAFLLRWATGAAEHAGTSTKNYALFMALAVWSGWYISRDIRILKEAAGGD